MADTTTTILSLTKPEVGASNDTWGAKINSNLDTIDGLFTTGPAVKIANGGTGGVTATAARTNLDVPGLSTTNTFTLAQTFTAGGTFNGLGTFNSNAIVRGETGTPNLAVSAATVSPAIFMQRSEGTLSAPTVPTNGQFMGFLDWRAYDSSAYRTAARIVGYVDGTVATNDTPGGISFQTTADGVGGALTERLRIGQDGDVLVTSNSLSISNADTTITRSAAGVLAVEGGVIPKENRANTFTANQEIKNASGAISLIINSATSTTGTIQFETAGSPRWLVFKTNTAESGSNAGSDLTISRYSDAGTYIGNVLTADRSDGTVDIPTLTFNTALSNSATGGIGYTTGSGGTVTQATSKNTGVTLNKPTGLITMNAASLASNTSVGFTLTNSTITSNDTVLVLRDSGGTTGCYIAFCDSVGSGSAFIVLRNLTGGALAEAVVLRFLVLKSANS